MGFERTTYVVNETDGQVELCVSVTEPADQNIGDVTFSLMVETQDGTASMSNKIMLTVYQSDHTHTYSHTYNSLLANPQWALIQLALA